MGGRGGGGRLSRERERDEEYIDDDCEEYFPSLATIPPQKPRNKNLFQELNSFDKQSF